MSIFLVCCVCSRAIHSTSYITLKFGQFISVNVGFFWFAAFVVAQFIAPLILHYSLDNLSSFSNVDFFWFAAFVVAQFIAPLILHYSLDNLSLLMPIFFWFAAFVVAQFIAPLAVCSRAIHSTSCCL